MSNDAQVPTADPVGHPFLSVVKMLHQPSVVTMKRTQLQFIRSAIRAAIKDLEEDGTIAIKILRDVDAALETAEHR